MTIKAEEGHVIISTHPSILAATAPGGADLVLVFGTAILSQNGGGREED